MMKFIWSLLLCLGLSVSVWAQTVTGTVTDENGDPMIGVNVIEKGTFNGAVTDFDGKYTLELTTESPVLVFRFVGYREHEVPYNGQTSIDHQMEEDQIGLDAVVVSASKRKEKVIDAPASVTLLNEDALEKTVATTPIDHLNKVPGVDVMKTGIVSSNVNIRGFNNIFSGAMLTVVDDRIARIPSLRVNAFQLIPTNNSDIQSMEVVRGPASALYGPNAADGVLAIKTRSPLDQEDDLDVTVGLTTGFRGKSYMPNPPDDFQHNDNFGERVLLSPELRISSKINDKIGIKLSGSYFTGNDFEFYDVEEPRTGDSVVLGSVRNGGAFVADSINGRRDLQSFERDFSIEKFNVDGRIDYRINNDMEVVLNGGIAQTSNIELTGLGAAQGINWKNYYAQARFSWRNLFAQYFMNGSNAGDTYLIPQGGNQLQRLIDKSKLHVFQIQHRTDQFKRTNDLDLIYGLDVLLTRPNTESTINGRFEDDDNINQVGAYGQAEYTLREKFIFLGALRIDYQDKINEVQFSPRAAFVYKPTPRHTLRATYNRAFNAPSSLNYSLDLAQQFVPNGITGRGIGNANGFNYRYDDNNLAEFRSPYDNNWYSVNNTSNNHVFFNDITQALGAVLGEGFGIDPGLGQQLVAAIVDGLVDPSSPVNGVDRVVTDFVTNERLDLRQINDVDPVQSTITQTYELGYKGIIKDKLFLTADAYYTRVDNFVSPLTTSSYRVQFNPEQLSSAITPTIAANLQSLSSFGITYDELLTGGFSSNINLDQNGNGTALEELLYLLAGDPSNPNDNGGIYDLSLGTVAPNDDLYGSDLLLSYQNLGLVDVFGIDIGATYVPTEELAVNWAFSHVNKDRIPLAGAANGFIGLNAPRWKTALGIDYEHKKLGIGASLNWRWQDAFPANSAVYVGEVVAHNFIDWGLRYRNEWVKGHTTTFGLDVTGFEGFLRDEWKFQPFPGTPFNGGLAMFRIQHNFGMSFDQTQAANQDF